MLDDVILHNQQVRAMTEALSFRRSGRPGPWHKMLTRKDLSFEQVDDCDSKARKAYPLIVWGISVDLKRQRRRHASV